MIGQGPSLYVYAQIPIVSPNGKYFAFVWQVHRVGRTAVVMIPLRSLGAFVAAGLVYACSGELSPTWTTPASSGVEPVGSGGTPIGTGNSSGGATSVVPTGTPIPGVSPSGTTEPVSPNGLTEESGYTPVLNADGSIARPMWLAGEVANTRFARLTNEQWQRSVRDLLKLSELPTEESQFFETIGAGATDFVNDQSGLKMSNTQWAQFQSASESLAQRVTETDQALQAVHPGDDAETFVREFGMRAFRRPLTDAEVTRYMTVFEAGAALSGSQSEFTKGAGLVIEVMLQSPHFLYRVEIGAAGTPLSGYEKAAKLSLYILRTTPSDELLAKAGRGELDSPDALIREARVMLETSDAAETFRAFHSELYELNRFSGLAKSDPLFTEAVGAELVAASEAFFERIYKEDHGLREILTTRRGFVGPDTAQFYGISPAPNTMTEVELPAERAGFFTQLPYLMYFSRDAQSYGILRGVHLNTEVLCAKLPELDMAAPPLPDVEYTTSREYMERGTLCGGACHSAYINLLGFSMENFDGLGRTRELDNGAPVDTTGSYPFVGATQPFEDAVDLMNIIATNEMAHECYSRYVATYGLGRMLGEDDRSLVESLAAQSLNDNASTKELVLSLVRSAEFSTREGDI
jgi:Protein of unknown function (DUF1595)/Protein of unknown function (DUF1592)/Protein of unknown function (DUF1585)/Protein of unknown function (DUF1588)/Protein of unknown function (DUF1587)